MALQHWQSTLADLVIAHAAPAGFPPPMPIVRAAPLTGSERRWLDRVAAEPGFQITCAVQHWWREFRIRSTLPLTLAALGSERCAQIVPAYLRASPAPSTFFLREALRFLDFLLARESDVPHLASVARFERALLLLTQTTAFEPPGTGGRRPLEPGLAIQTHPAADVVAFSAPPEQVIAALLNGATPPAPGATEHLLLLAPRLPNLARRATVHEAVLFAAVRAGLVRRVRATWDAEAADACAQLWEAGALAPA